MVKFISGTSGYIGSRADWLDMPDIECLEINSSFYRLPTENSIENFIKLSETPQHKNLIYSVKVSKLITHMKKLNDCRSAWHVFYTAVKGLGERLRVFLFQMPPSFKYNETNLSRLRKLTYLPKTSTKLNIVFEFRDSSWFNKKDVVSLFKTNGWVIGATLINKERSSSKWMGDMPGGLHLPERTTNCTYLRIHGGRGFRGDYDKKELNDIERKITAKKTSTNYVIFNNVFFNKRGKTCKYNKRTIKYAALCNASEFGKMTRKNRSIKNKSIKNKSIKNKSIKNKSIK